MLADITDALGRGDIAAALGHADALLAKEPGNATAHHLRGICLQRSGDPAGARAAFERAVGLDPESAESRVSLAALQLAVGEREPALRLLDEAVSLNPNQLVAYVLLAQDALARGDLEEAGRNVRLAQRIAPAHPQVLVLDGYLAEASGDAERALKCLTRAVEVAPNSSTAQLAVGRAYLARGMWPFAEQALANALRLDPVVSPATVQLLVRARVAQGKAEEALQGVDEALARNPDDLRLLSLRGQVRLDLGRPRLALEDLCAVLDREPLALPVLGTAVTVLERTGRAAEAVERCEKAVAGLPDQDDAWRLLHKAVLASGADVAPVIERWRQALPDSLANLEVRAVHEEARGDFDAALALADQALARNPGLFNSNLIRARAEMASAPEAALARLGGLLATASAPPAQRVVHHAMGTVHNAIGQHAEAAASFRAMASLPSDQPAPVPNVLPASPESAGEAGATFLWTIVGHDARRLLATLRARMGERMVFDRLGRLMVPDGFGTLRFEEGHAEAGTAARWHEWRQSQGLDTAALVDWLPHVDPRTFNALGGSRWLAALVDPRDALLGWLVRGSLQGYAFPTRTEVAAEWLARVLEALADLHAREPGQVVLARLDDASGEGLGVLSQALGLEEPLPAFVPNDPRFPPGHWRHYRAAFAQEFARLAPVAERLGYPAD